MSFKTKYSRFSFISFIVWLISIIGFFIIVILNGDNSTYSDLSTYLLLSTIGIGIISFLLGFTFLFIHFNKKLKHSHDLNKETATSNTHKNKSNWSYIFIIIFLICLILGYLEIPQNIYKRVTLESTYNKLLQYENSNNYEGTYSLLNPQDKLKVTFEDFKRDYTFGDVYSSNVEINSINLKDDIGLINRTRIVCFSSSCEGDDRVENTLTKRFIFINGNWYSMLEGTVLCTRENPYIMPEEFNRGMSLVIQRLSESNNNEANNVSKRFKQLRNCVDIQYASSNSDLAGAEGVFILDETSTQEHLKILVSPSYSIKDDLLTAVLLSHELSHAYDQSIGSNSLDKCFENEALAFTNEYVFMNSLNPEEKESLASRYLNSSSQNVKDLLNHFIAINNLEGDYFSDKALIYVQSSDFYQKQCSLAR